MGDGIIEFRRVGNLAFGHAIDHAQRFFVTRLKDIGGLLVHNGKLEDVHEQTGATIAFWTNGRTRVTRHVLVGLVGTQDAVIAAVNSIRSIIRGEYALTFHDTPMLLMWEFGEEVHENIQRFHVPISISEALKLFGKNDIHVVKMEARFPAWIQVEPENYPDVGAGLARRLRAYCTEAVGQNILDSVALLLDEPDSDIED